MDPRVNPDAMARVLAPRYRRLCLVSMLIKLLFLYVYMYAIFVVIITTTTVIIIIIISRSLSRC
jgi:hypothetical protein